ncbi:hypothetical protein ABT061_40390 [Streptosporangium sp. NPDC002544]|uniref:hypothetical protein n=1 Tax=Streptosporangium sp. NPDC002544 TaxID=3154538 RepID=UPI00332EAD64
MRHPGKVSGILGPVRRIYQPAHQSCGALTSEQVRGRFVGFSAITTGTPASASAAPTWPPDLRELERAARAEHARRQREAAARSGDPTRPRPGLRSEPERRQAYRPPPGRGVDRGPGLSR